MNRRATAITIDPSVLSSIQEGRTVNERKAHSRKKQAKQRLDRVCVLDMETDPFDDKEQTRIAPFCACLYSDHFEPIVLWEEDEKTFVTKLIAEIEALPDAYTIYAHNGGKFDFMFLLHRLRGDIMFKGRGIMSATIGRHMLRDSFHIIPEKLAAYSKEKFDYTKLKKRNRKAHRDDIIRYLVSDCKNLLEIVKDFLETYGFKISIGQAAMAVLKENYKVKPLMPNDDAMLRNYFFGGRVECLGGKGIFDGPFKLYDVNSMYPFVMAEYEHPIGNKYITRAGKPGPNTIFIQLECFNKGALVRRTENNDTEATWGKGKFLTTIWEYNVAIKYGLIEKVKIIACIDCEERSNFALFVKPLYERRQVTKAKLRLMDETEERYAPTKREDIFLKLIMNNAYGKFAQNPRRFEEHYITEPNDKPPEEAGDFGMFPKVETTEYMIWSRPTPRQTFNNVGTAASITGAARSVLLEAMQNATGAIYCDTDSLICRELHNTPLSETELGAWDVEREMSQVLIAGKKLYAYRDLKGGEKVKSKGASGLQWDDMLRLIAGEIVETVNPAPTFTKAGTQFYMRRKVRATAKEKRNGRDKESISCKQSITA